MYGAPRLIHDLREIGHEAVEIVAPDGSRFAAISRYAVSVGRFLGRVIDLGIPATPDFPKTVGSAIHVRATPQLFDFADTVPNVRNITQSALGVEWRYWSHNFQWQEERSARRLMSQINTIFANA